MLTGERSPPTVYLIFLIKMLFDNCIHLLKYAKYMDIKLLSVIVPVYKQEKTIQKDLLNINETLSKTPYEYEIIAVVDGTELDKSYEKAKELNNRKIKVYGYSKNHGKGQAVRYGMHKAKGDVISFIDSGMDIDPEGIIMLLEHMKWYDADIIIGSKLHPASKISNYGAKRKILTYGYYFGVKTLFGLKVKDTQTGVKAYKREVLEKVLDKLVVKTYTFDIEILVVANSMGFTKIYDAPVIVNWDENNTSLAKVFKSRIILNFMIDTVAIWYRLRILNYYKNGKKRVKVYDKDLDMNVNTGDMYGQKQVLINFINKYIPKLLNK